MRRPTVARGRPWIARAPEVTEDRRCTLGEVKTYTLLDRDGRSYQSPTPGTLGGHRRGNIYGRLDCPTALRSIAKGQYVTYRVFFADEEVAIAAGFRPCGHCLRPAYREWVADHGSRVARVVVTPVTDP